MLVSFTPLPVRVGIAVMLVLVCVGGAEAQQTAPVSDRPADRWEDALLSGSGLVGVMQYGDPAQERFVLNSHEFILPNGQPTPIPDMTDMVEPMRDLMLAGKIGEGWALYHEELQKRGIPGMQWTQGFHPGYVLNLEQPMNGEVNHYQRQTNYRTGEITVNWQDKGGAWSRRTFASRAGDFIATLLTASSEKTALSLSLSVTPAEKHRTNVPTEVVLTKEFVNFRAKYPVVNGKQGGYEGVTRVVTDGEIAVTDKKLKIDGAQHVLLITKLGRYRDDFNGWDKQELQQSLRDIKNDYESLLAEHVAIHQPIFDRATLSLGASEADRQLSNEALLAKEAASGEDLNVALMERLFATSRYLFLASSGKDYAPRLSGMFIGAWGAAWAGDYTCDANVNLAVLGGNIAAMPEAMEGYFAVLERTQDRWREAAQQLYGCLGILGPVRIDGETAVPHHVNDYHAHCTATGLGPWLLFPMWEHYQITGDQEFLQQRLYPLLRQQTEFYQDFLTRRDDNGKRIFVPSNSPENAWAGVQPRTSASINSTMDIAACKHGLTMYLAAEKVLGIAASELTKQAEQMLKEMPPYLVNKEGALQEWSWPGHGENYGHRHSSHVYPVWPAYEITPDNRETSHLVGALEVALDKRRMRISQAHDALQKAIAWIRLKRGDRLDEILTYMLHHDYLYRSLATSHNDKLHIYNYDFILCLQGLLIEMAVYTDEGLIELLPALPESFPSGKLSGIVGRNQTTIHSLEWDTAAKTIRCELTSAIDQKLTLIHRAGIEKLGTSVVVAPSPLGEFAREITLVAGETAKFVIGY